MDYTVKMQSKIARAAELAACAGLSDCMANYEQVANGFVGLVTGFAEHTAEFADARSDFDYMLEQAL